MTLRYVGLGGDDGNTGLSWAARKLTLNGVEDTPVAAGDIVYVAPGVYRESLTVDVSGANNYTTGTVSVTNGSTTVVGASTLWAANAAANYIFHVSVLAHGTDGVTNGTSAFTSATGNFQAGHVGQTIRINTKAAAIIATVGGTTAITLADVAGTAVTPSAANTLTYDVGPEPPYEIASVTDDTHLELTQPWSGPTLTGLAYLVYNPIRYIGDVTGEHTDGLGGIVRWTGSTADLVADRASCITATSKNYRLFQGFMFDTTSSVVIYPITCTDWILQDFSIQNGANAASIAATGAAAARLTIRRGIFLTCYSAHKHIQLTHTSAVDNVAHYVGNCLFIGGAYAVGITRIGGILVKNCEMRAQITKSINNDYAMTVGQAVTCNNSIFTGSVTGIGGTAANEVVENFNNIYGVATPRGTGVIVGAGSAAVPPLFIPPLHTPGFQLSWYYGSLSNWSTLINKAGFSEAADDFNGITRPITSAERSWGALQYQGGERSSLHANAGTYSIRLPAAGRVQFLVPTTATSTTFTVQVYRHTGYAGVAPQMVIRQPGVAITTVTDAGAAESWNALATTLVPAASPGYVIVELVSNNTAAISATTDIFFDDLVVS